MQRSKRPGRKSTGSEPDVSSKDLESAFHDAIWDAAGKFDMRDTKGHLEKKEDMPDELVWKEDNVLSFRDFCVSRII